VDEPKGKKFIGWSQTKYGISEYSDVNKYKQKKMLEQFVMDFLITLEYFRKQVAEVALFHDFFIEKTYDSSDLTFYLFMRTQAEKEIGV
jgi:hypothetical protein